VGAMIAGKENEEDQKNEREDDGWRMDAV